MGSFSSRPRPPVDEEAARAAETAAQAQRGLYFGPHFVMGGQRFATPANPEVFLFGGLAADSMALSSFGMNRIPHPMPDLQATTTVKSFVNLKKSSLHLVRDQGQEQKFGLEFKFDSEKDCVISVYCVCKESTEQNSTVFTCLHENSSYSKPFSKGMDQAFVLPEEAYLNVAKYSPEELLEDDDSHPKGVLSVVVLMETKTESGERVNIQSQSTYATLTKSADGVYDLKVTKQRVMVDGVSYILQEIFGIEHAQDSSQDTAVDDGLENTRECVVCMSDPKDTIALPCRHMCLCSQCAEQLRFQSNKCPICRQPFHSLLQIKIGEPKDPEENEPSSDGNQPTTLPVIDIVVVDDKEKEKGKAVAVADLAVSENLKKEVTPSPATELTTVFAAEVTMPLSDPPESSVKKEKKSRKSKASRESGDESLDELEAGASAKKPKKAKARKESGGEESFDELDTEVKKAKKAKSKSTKESAGEESFDELDAEAVQKKSRKSKKKASADAISEAPELDGDIFSGEEQVGEGQEKPRKKKKKSAKRSESTVAMLDE